MSKEGKKIEISSDELKFFQEYTDFIFGDRIDVTEFEKELEENTTKLLIDFLVLINYPRISRYAGKFIKSEKINELVIEFQEQFRDTQSEFTLKLNEKDQKLNKEYWFKKELTEAALFLLIFSISNNQRRKQDEPFSEHAVNIVATHPLEEKLGAFVTSTLLSVATFGDLINYYSNHYVSDFEYLFGNYIEPVFSELVPNPKGYTSRHKKILSVSKYLNSKFDPLFRFMNSSFRNALAHKSYFVIETKNKIRYRDHQFKITEIKLNELEEYCFRLKILRYLLITSEEELKPLNNMVIKIMLNIFRVAVEEPQLFMEVYENIIEITLESVLTKNKMGPLSFFVSRYQNLIMGFILKQFLVWLDFAGYLGRRSIISFLLQFYNLVHNKPSEQIKEKLVKKLVETYKEINSADKDEGTKLKKYIQICLIKFINTYESDEYLIMLLKQLKQQSELKK